MTYILSDIHGNLARFESILSQIDLQLKDTLYILGDVIDRYPNGIKILRRIMKMPNVKMLLGNHEYMMLNAIGNCRNAAEEKQYADEWSMRIWYHNGGRETHKQLKRIPITQRAEIFAFLRVLPVNLDVEVNGIRYKLVHASPEENYSPQRIYNKHRYDDSAAFAVWNRWYPTDPVPEGFTMIFGHTPTYHLQDDYPLQIWKGERAIGIDCGCGYMEGRLACLRLDDLAEFYSED